MEESKTPAVETSSAEVHKPRVGARESEREKHIRYVAQLLVARHGLSMNEALIRAEEEMDRRERSLRKAAKDRSKQRARVAKGDHKSGRLKGLLKPSKRKIKPANKKTTTPWQRLSFYGGRIKVSGGLPSLGKRR
jgi:hypothetical protein